MEDVEVLGVELPQFAGSSFKAIVPRVYGQTEKIRQTKQRIRNRGPRITLQDFVDRCPDYLKDFFIHLVNKARELGMEPYWGRTGFSLRSSDIAGTKHSLFYGFPPTSESEEYFSIQGYVGDLENDQLKEQCKSEFLKVPGTTAKGQYTINLYLTGENMDAANDLLQVVWKWNDLIKQM
jgi:hypothetical protein